VTEFLAVEQVIAIHRAVAGDVALVRPDGLHSAVGLQRQSVFGQDAYPTIIDKAAALMRSLAENQPFEDGNKRVAWASARVLLEANGVAIRATVEEVVHLLTVDLAVNRIGVPELAVFLRAHIVETPGES
jgi:death-on-curing protein